MKKQVGHGHDAHITDDSQETYCGLSIVGLILKPFTWIGAIGCKTCRMVYGMTTKGVENDDVEQNH